MNHNLSLHTLQPEKWYAQTLISRDAFLNKGEKKQEKRGILDFSKKNTSPPTQHGLELCATLKKKKRKKILHSREKGFIHFPMCEEILLPLFTGAREEHAAFIRTVKYLLVVWDEQNLYPYSFRLRAHMLPPVRTLKLALTIQKATEQFSVLLILENYWRNAKLQYA